MKMSTHHFDRFTYFVFVCYLFLVVFFLIIDILPINALVNPARSFLQHNRVKTFLHDYALLRFVKLM